MNKIKESYMLPDGEYTTNATKMAREWEDVYQPICDEFELDVIGFNPDILFKKGSKSFNLPVSFCIQLKDMIKAKNEYLIDLDSAMNRIEEIQYLIKKLLAI